MKDAVRFYIAHHEAASKSCTVEAAVDEYLKIQRLKRRSDRHIADLKYRLGVFKERFGTTLISSLSVRDSENWLHGLGQSPKSLNNFHIAVSALLGFAAKRSYAVMNPFDAIDKVRVPAKAPGILSPEECQNLLNAAADDILPLVSIQAFCGVRSAETLRLNWSDVDLARGFVQIAAEQAKGARRRLVEMPANLKAWLLPDSAGPESSGHGALRSIIGVRRRHGLKPKLPIGPLMRSAIPRITRSPFCAAWISGPKRAGISYIMRLAG